MEVMFWVWLGVIVLTAVIEFATMEIASIWFTIGAIIPFILSAIGGIRWEIQLAVFVVISALLIIFLRGWTRRTLLKNTNEKTNIDSFIGKQTRMLSCADFENIGSVKINGVVWSALPISGVIEADEIVEIVKVDGNKLLVRAVGAVETKQSQEKLAQAKKSKEKITNKNSKGGN